MLIYPIGLLGGAAGPVTDLGGLSGNVIARFEAGLGLPDSNRMAFDGSAYVTIGDIPSYELNSFSIKLKARTGTLGAYRYLFTLQTQILSADGTAGTVLRWKNDNKIQALVYNNFGTSIIDTPLAYTDTEKEYEIELVKAGSNVKIYVDGELVRDYASGTSDYVTNGVKKTGIGVAFGGVSGLPQASYRATGPIWDVVLKDGDGTIVGQWDGTGNTDADWADMSGNGNDGTVGSAAPLAGVDTWLDQSGNGNDVAFDPAPILGLDPVGRTCVAATGTQRGQVDYGASYAQPWIRAVVFKMDADTAAVSDYFCDGLDADSRAMVFESNTTGRFFAYSGSNLDTGIAADLGWHYVVFASDGVSTKVYVDGVEEVAGTAGTHPLKGATLLHRFEDYASAAGLTGRLASLIDVATVTDLEGDAAVLNAYLANRYFS